MTTAGSPEYAVVNEDYATESLLNFPDAEAAPLLCAGLSDIVP